MLVDLSSLHPTPFYAYDLALLNNTLNACRAAANQYGFHVHYALKANTNSEIVECIVNKGFGADCVSGNEVLFALKHGFLPEQIAFAGVGKSDQEIELGLKHNIFSFNVESLEELMVIHEIANQHSTVAKVALRINPNVNAKTHQYITTGIDENKFGINAWQFPALIDTIRELKNVNIIGLHFHIGSQITDLEVFKNLCVRVNEIQSFFKSHNLVFPHLNLGGGLGIDYEHPSQQIPDFQAYFNIFNQLLDVYPNQEKHFELGRSLVAQCGSLITKVLFIKKGLKKNFAIVDAGMTELLRPALYQAYHKIEALAVRSEKEKYDVVGPICESSDCFGKEIELYKIERGDFLQIFSTGAYGEVMSNGYNLREKVKAYYY